MTILLRRYFTLPDYKRRTVCPGSSDTLEKILNIFASENEVYTIFKLLYVQEVVTLRKNIKYNCNRK